VAGDGIGDRDAGGEALKARLYASRIIGALMGVVFIYGLIQYPDAPIHPCLAHGYCGKQSQPHTQQEFEEFKLWETTLIWSWPIGMLALFLLKEKKPD
jgi:hypothetical protein